MSGHTYMSALPLVLMHLTLTTALAKPCFYKCSNKCNTVSVLNYELILFCGRYSVESLFIKKDRFWVKNKSVHCCKKSVTVGLQDTCSKSYF